MNIIKSIKKLFKTIKNNNKTTKSKSNCGCGGCKCGKSK